MGLACVLAGVRVSGGRLVDQQIVVFGAGSAGVGIADLIALAMTEDGLSAEEAAGRIYLLDRPGLLTSDMTDLYDYQQPYAKDPAAVAGLARTRTAPWACRRSSTTSTRRCWSAPPA